MSAFAIVCMLLAFQPALAQVSTKARLDAHGFPLPDGAITRLGDLHLVSPEPINAVALSPDGKLIASACRDISFWNPDTGRVVREIKTPDWIRLLAWSRNGQLLASMNQEGDFTVWNVATGKAFWPNNLRTPKSDKNVTDLRFVGADRWLAIVLEDWCVELWDVEKGTLDRTWKVDAGKRKQLKALGDGSVFHGITLSPSGDQMAWLASTGGPFKDGGNDIFVPDDVINDGRSAALIFETDSGRLLREVKGLRPTYRIDLPDEGQTLVLAPALGKPPEKVDVKTWAQFAVVGTADGRVRFHCIYRARTAHVSLYRPQKPKRYVYRTRSAFQYGKSLVTWDGHGLMRWSLDVGKKLGAWDEDFMDLAIAAGGNRAVVSRGRRLHLCDEALKPMRAGTEFSEGPLVDFLPDHRLYTQARWEGRLNVWDLEQGKIVETLWRHTSPRVGREPCSHDSWRKLFAYHFEKGLAIRDLVTDRQVCLLEGVKVEGDVWRVYPSLSPDGKRVLVSSEEKDGLLVRWFETSNGRELGRYLIPKNERYPPFSWPIHWFSEDGSVFGYTTPDSRLALIDCVTRKKVQVVGLAVSRRADVEVRGRPEWDYCSAGYDRFLLASRSNEAFPDRREYAVWDRASGQMFRRFYLQPDGVEKHQWHGRLSPDGRFLAVHGWDQDKIVLYETATGKRCGEIRAPGAIEDFAFAPDGKTLATSCADTTVLIWDMNRPLNAKPALPPPRDSAETKLLWQALGNSDALAAESALWALVNAPKQALPLLKQHLQPVRSSKRLHALIAQLDSANYQEREKATAELTVQAELAVPALRTVFEKNAVSLEQRRRIEQLLAKVEDPGAIPQCLRELRALEVLERIGTVAARQLVEMMATGDEDARLTREARSVLARWR